MDTYRAKIGKKTEEFKSTPVPKPASPQPEAGVLKKPKRTSKGVPPGGKMGVLAESKSESAED